MHDLKPCPFCGSEVYFTTMYVGNGEENCIACEGCDMIFTIDWLSHESYPCYRGLCRCGVVHRSVYRRLHER